MSITPRDVCVYHHRAECGVPALYFKVGNSSFNYFVLEYDDNDNLMNYAYEFTSKLKVENASSRIVVPTSD
jgi:hypothetical protein